MAGETGTWTSELDVGTVKRWCEEFQEARVTGWQQTVTDFGQAWKRWCFAQRQTKSWQDNFIREAIKSFWQPLNDFNHVLSLYSFLEGVRNRNLQPHLRRTYMAWRSPEQTRFHESCDLKNLSSDGMFRDDESRATASKYPLTMGQHLRVARICDDAAGKLKALQHWLDEFQNRRVACVMASQEAGPSSAFMARCRWNLTDAAREFSSLAKTLTKQFRDCRTHLCEALGLDPKQVPGGNTASVPTMTAMKYKKAPDILSSPHGGSTLPRRFWREKASLQALRIALKANLYITLMPRKTAQKFLERMMARATDMATTAREAGDYKAEATMYRLHNKIRKISERADQEFPDVKPRMTLLDSETWPAVLNPRKDMLLEVHGHISTPVEALIDMLLAPQVPVSTPASRPSAGLTTTAPGHPCTERSSGCCQSLTASSSAMAVPEAGADET